MHASDCPRGTRTPMAVTWEDGACRRYCEMSNGRSGKHATCPRTDTHLTYMINIVLTEFTLAVVHDEWR
jgi:hypothetical protein